MAFTLDTKIGTILDDPRAKAVVDKYLPGAASNPMVAMAKGMTINMILAMPQAAQMGITKEKAEMLLVEVNKVIG
ncbi:MAG TPA: hypothetical protein VF338_08350 [Leptolinea sp.]